jgi:3-oxoacyl-[acyl-carrier-protein] synthase-3
MIYASITSAEYHLPEKLLSNDELAKLFPEWPATKIEEKLGIVSRAIAADDEFSSDLAVKAAEKLFASGVCSPSEIDFVLLCTQTPDYLLPPSACLIQKRLGIPKTAGALDFNLGCSGYIYGLGLAKGLIETRQARNLLLLTGETYSKLLAPGDKSTRTLFGDAGTATLITGRESEKEALGPFTYGTDGSGAEYLIVRGARRGPLSTFGDKKLCLEMNGGEIFTFSVREVSDAVGKLLQASQLHQDSIDLFIFHQANAYMLSFLKRKCCIPDDKFYIWYATVGNTVSNTIPIALHHALADGRIQPGMTVMLVGFGVGLSWGACIVRF